MKIKVPVYAIDVLGKVFLTSSKTVFQVKQVAVGKNEIIINFIGSTNSESIKWNNFKDNINNGSYIPLIEGQYDIN